MKNMLMKWKECDTNIRKLYIKRCRRENLLHQVHTFILLTCKKSLKLEKIMITNAKEISNIKN